VTTVTPQPLRASAQHIELLQDKRRLAHALVSAELQFLAVLRREYDLGEMSWAQLRDAYSTLSAGRQRGLRARWMDAIEVSPEKVIVNAKREAAVGAGGVWRGHRPLRRGECYPPNGQCVVYVLFDADHHPISIHSTNRFSQRLADHRAQDERWSSWAAQAVDSAEAHEIQARIVSRYKTNLNRQYWYFVRWEQAKATEKILPVVRAQLRLQQGRNAEPSAGLIDSQSVKGADTVGRDTRGYDAGKKINGRKRFIVTDTLGLLLVVVVVAASMQDRDGAKPVLLDTYLRTRARFVFADGGFAGRLLDWATQVLRTTVQVVREPADQRGFAVIPRRWAVERMLAWLTAHRRPARDYERDPALSEAMIRWPRPTPITRRLAHGAPATRQQRRTFQPVR
jgi:transposase